VDREEEPKCNKRKYTNALDHIMEGEGAFRGAGKGRLLAIIKGKGGNPFRIRTKARYHTPRQKGFKKRRTLACESSRKGSGGKVTPIKGSTQNLS